MSKNTKNIHFAGFSSLTEQIYRLINYQVSNATNLAMFLETSIRLYNDRTILR